MYQLIGKRDTFVGQIREHEKELTKPQYQNIDERYRQMLIKVKTTQMANSDLDKYYNALNKYVTLTLTQILHNHHTIRFGV